MRRKLIGVIMIAVQALGALFFIGNIALSTLGLQREPIDWRLYEFMEIGAAVALLIGLVMSTRLLMKTQRRLGQAQARLQKASTGFMELLEQHFAQWRLTPAERDVAFFVIKGFSTQEIAGFRKTSEGTIKAQTNAIFRKAGVTGRGQLLSIFIDDLLADRLTELAARDDNEMRSRHARK